MDSLVQLDVIGEKTKTRWMGSFKIKAQLTHQDRFRVERAYAELMPRNEANAPEEIKMRAQVSAELFVRVIHGPSWWSDSQQGQLLIDTSPLYELIRLVNEEEERWLKAVEKSTKGNDGGLLEDV